MIAYWGLFIGHLHHVCCWFQIFNYIYYANKMDALDKEKERLRSKLEELESISVRSMYFNAYTIGRTRFQMAEGYHYKEQDKEILLECIARLVKCLEICGRRRSRF